MEGIISSTFHLILPLYLNIFSSTPCLMFYLLVHCFLVHPETRNCVWVGEGAT